MATAGAQYFELGGLVSLVIGLDYNSALTRLFVYLI